MCAQQSSLHTYRTENRYRIIKVTIYNIYYQIISYYKNASRSSGRGGVVGPWMMTGGSTVHVPYSLSPFPQARNVSHLFFFEIYVSRLERKDILVAPTPIPEEHAIHHIATTVQARLLLLRQHPCTCCCSTADAHTDAVPPLMDGGDGEEEDAVAHESRG
jgi:hypothetical protein